MKDQVYIPQYVQFPRILMKFIRKWHSQKISFGFHLQICFRSRYVLQILGMIQTSCKRELRYPFSLSESLTFQFMCPYSNLLFFQSYTYTV